MSEFGRWLDAFMTTHGLGITNVSAATGRTPKTVYGWLAGVPPDNEKPIRTTLLMVYERDAARGGALPSEIRQGQ